MEKFKKKHSSFIDRTGEKHITNEGYPVEIITYRSKKDCDIKFENGVIVKNREYNDILKGNVKNPYHKSIYRIGYFGIGKYDSKTHLKIYDTWVNMLRRCYYEKYQEKHPTYIGCSVDEYWHNFQVFAKWFDENYKAGYQLDKDILSKGNKIYSPETCCFVPSDINVLFTKRDAYRGKHPIGVSKAGNKFKSCIRINGKTIGLGYFNTPKEAFQAYKTAKETHIKEVAEIWKPKLATKTYEALINYQVEITD